MNAKAILNNTPVGKFKIPFAITKDADLEDAYHDANLFVLDLKEVYGKAGKVLHDYNTNFVPSESHPHVVVSFTVYGSEQEIANEFFKEMDRERQAHELMRKKYEPISNLARPNGNVIS